MAATVSAAKLGEGMPFKARNMIDVHVSHGMPLVWNATDKNTLRKKYRIIGSPMGPVHDQHSSRAALPLLLMPEEAYLLKLKGIARLVHQPSLLKAPSEEMQQKAKEEQDRNVQQQIDMHREKRKTQLQGMMEKIREGKRKKRRKKIVEGGTQEDEATSSEAADLDVTSILEVEMKKTDQLIRENAFVDFRLEYPWANPYQLEPPEWTFPSTSRERLRFRVFCDLWEQHLYLTPGIKFGGDFLAYKQDPRLGHADYIIICRDDHQPLGTIEMSRHGRLASTVAKTVVYASVDDDQSVMYNMLERDEESEEEEEGEGEEED